MSTDHREQARTRIEELIARLRQQPQQDLLKPLLVECEALVSAIAAFHMEGIRFRMYNVDRLLTKETLPLPAEASSLFADVRRALEAAGFHTRSHQAPV